MILDVATLKLKFQEYWVLLFGAENTTKSARRNFIVKVTVLKKDILNI